MEETARVAKERAAEAAKHGFDSWHDYKRSLKKKPTKTREQPEKSKKMITTASSMIYYDVTAFTEKFDVQRLNDITGYADVLLGKYAEEPVLFTGSREPRKIAQSYIGIFKAGLAGRREALIGEAGGKKYPDVDLVINDLLTPLENASKSKQFNPEVIDSIASNFATKHKEQFNSKKRLGSIMTKLSEIIDVSKTLALGHEAYLPDRRNFKLGDHFAVIEDRKIDHVAIELISTKFKDDEKAYREGAAPSQSGLIKAELEEWIINIRSKNMVNSREYMAAETMAGMAEVIKGENPQRMKEIFGSSESQQLFFNIAEEMTRYNQPLQVLKLKTRKKALRDKVKKMARVDVNEWEIAFNESMDEAKASVDDDVAEKTGPKKQILDKAVHNVWSQSKVLPEHLQRTLADMVIHNTTYWGGEGMLTPDKIRLDKLSRKRNLASMLVQNANLNYLADNEVPKNLVASSFWINENDKGRVEVKNERRQAEDISFRPTCKTGIVDASFYSKSKRIKEFQGYANKYKEKI